MKYIVSFLLVAFLGFEICVAQVHVFDWVSTTSGDGNCENRGMVVDSDGTIVNIGVFYNTIDVDPGEAEFHLVSEGNEDIFVQKLSPTGELIWAKSFGGIYSDQSRSVCVNQDGDIFITGSFGDTLTFQSGESVLEYSALGLNDAFVLKLNSDGEVVWFKHFGGINNDSGWDVCVDNQENVITTGVFRSNVDFDPDEGVVNIESEGYDDVFTLKLDAEGSLIWVKVIAGAGNSSGYAVSVDQDDNVYTTGRYFQSVDFDPGENIDLRIAHSHSDGFIQKLNSDGEFLWANTVEGSWFNSSVDVITDTDNNVFVIGDVGGEGSFLSNSGEELYTAASMSDMFIQKLDSEGNSSWLNIVGNLSPVDAASIHQSNDGSLFVTGTFRNFVDFDPGPDTASLPLSENIRAFVLRLNENGEFLWVTEFGGHNDVNPVAVQTDFNQHVFVSGWNKDTVDFDPGLGIVERIANGHDGFVLKLQPCAPSELVPEDISLPPLVDSCVVMPNIPIASNGCETYAGNTSLELPISNEGITELQWIINDFINDPIVQFQEITILPDTQAPVPELDSLPLWDASCEDYILTIYNRPIAEDNCGGLIEAETETFVISEPGTHEIVWTYDDGKGNVTTQTQMAVLGDFQPPVPNLETLETINACIGYFPETPFATDNCSGEIAGVSSIEFPLTEYGMYTLWWSYTDDEENTSFQNQIIYIDNEAPIPLEETLPDLTFDCDVYLEDLEIPLAATLCSGNIHAVTSQIFPLTDEGVYEIQWVFDGENGLQTFQTQTISLEDAEDPVPNVHPLPAFTALCDITFDMLSVPNATDNCLGLIAGSTNVDFPIPIGSLPQISWIFDDGKGNIIQQYQPIDWQQMDVSLTVEGDTITANNPDAEYQWVDCDNNFSSFFGENNQSFTVLFNGNYAVELTQEGCTAISECVLLSTVHIDERNKSLGVKVFPNPSTGRYFMKFDVIAKNRTFKIVDMLGRTVKSQSLDDSATAQFDLEGPKGFYYLIIETDHHYSTFQLIKN